MISPPGKTVPKPNNPVVIGRIARPVGMKGEVKVNTESTHPNRMLDLDHIIIKLGDDYKRINVINSVCSGGSYKFQLEEISTPEDARLLSGCEIVVSEKNRIKLPKHEYYIDDLIGCAAADNNNNEIGIVKEIWHQGHHDIWVIEGPFGEILVPAVKDFILDVDLEKHRIVVKHMEGLWVEG